MTIKQERNIEWELFLIQNTNNEIKRMKAKTRGGANPKYANIIAQNINRLNKQKDQSKKNLLE